VQTVLFLPAVFPGLQTRIELRVREGSKQLMRSAAPPDDGMRCGPDVQRMLDLLTTGDAAGFLPALRVRFRYRWT